MHRMITMNKNTLESFNLILLFGYYYCYNTFFIVRGGGGYLEICLERDGRSLGISATLRVQDKKYL